MRRILFVLGALAGIGAAVFFLTQDRARWASVDTPQSFVFEDVTLRVVATGAAADLDELAADPFLGPMFVGMDDALRTETARGYGTFDPTTQVLKLFVGGEVTEVTYAPDVPVATAQLPGAGPIEVRWDNSGLSADVVAPVMTFGVPSEWAFHIPLVSASDVATRVTAQADIIAQEIAEKAEWRENMLGFAEEFADGRAFKTDTNDAWLPGWQAALSYPENARFVPTREALGGRVPLSGDQVVNITGYRPDVADEKLAEIRAIFAALPDDEKLIVQDTDDLFIAIPYGKWLSVAARVQLEHVTYVVSADLRYWDDIGVVVAMADSLSQRPLGPPSFDPLTITREEMRVAMGLPTFKIGREDELDPTSGARSDLEVMLRPENLMSNDSSWTNRESNFYAYRTDGEYGSILWAEFECFPVLGTPVSAAAVHDTYIAKTAFDPKLQGLDIRLMDYINDGSFAANTPFAPTGDFETPDFAAEWFVDTPSYAFGAYGPYYMAYRLDQVGDVSIFCATHDVDPLAAWMKMDLHGDVERPAPVTLSPEVKAQFAAYPDARPFGPGFYTIGVPFTDNKRYLIADDGTVLIPERLEWWDWDEQTETITAEDEDDKVGLYLPDGTQLLDHVYDEIGGRTPTIVRLDQGDDVLYYDVKLRGFVDSPFE